MVYVVCYTGLCLDLVSVLVAIKSALYCVKCKKQMLACTHAKLGW